LAEIDQQIKKVRESIIEVSEALEVFRRKNNLFDTSVRVTEISNALSAIELQQRTAKLEYEQAIAKLAGLQRNLPLSPQEAILLTRLNQSLRYQALLAEMQTTEVALNRERARFQESNPIVEALTIRFNQQKQSLEEERKSILGDANLSASPNSSVPKWNSNQLGTADLLIASQIADTQNQVTLLQTRLDSLSSQENSLRAEINRLPKLITEYESLKPKVQIQQDSLQSLLRNRQELSLQIARGGFDWQVVEEPALGKTNFADTLRINLLVGVVVGLFLGGAAALIRDRQDDTLHSFDELEQYLSSLELLGMTPQYLETDEISTELLPQFLKEQTFSPFASELFQWVPFRESLDLIYKNIQFRNHAHPEQTPVRSLVITSALSGEGKSTIAIGLATCAARLHKRVLLIDADMRKPTLHKKLNLSNARGLSTLLASQGSVDSRDVIQSSNTTIDVLTAGPIPKDSVTLLSSEWLQQLISSFEEDYDFVIIDSPPVLGTVDTIQIATCSSAVVAVGRIDRITRGEFTQAISILQKLNLIGVIANGVKELPHIYSADEIDDNEEEN
jgi:capsular exopolysaccharide synthesis family protein